MTCKEIRELMPDLALGLTEASADAGEHLRTCGECAGKLNEIRKTMAVLDEWQAPEPSPYFDTRLQARLREEKATAPAGWWAWARRPAMALVAAAVLVAGITVYRGKQGTQGPGPEPVAVATPGTAVGDLQQLDKNGDLYSDADTDLLDDLQVQPENATP
jgi:predicted anti-sigma-YlaC factor YlaD